MECQGFTWDLPCYALAARETVTLEDGIAVLDDNIRFIAPESANGDRALALFTAPQLAQEFHQQGAVEHDLVLFNIPDAESLWRLLNRAGDLYGYVLFDLKQAPREIGRILSFQELLQAVAQELDHLGRQGDQ